MSNSGEGAESMVRNGESYLKEEKYDEALECFTKAEKKLILEHPTEDSQFDNYYNLNVQLYEGKANAYKAKGDGVFEEMSRKQALKSATALKNHKDQQERIS